MLLLWKLESEKMKRGNILAISITPRVGLGGHK